MEKNADHVFKKNVNLVFKNINQAFETCVQKKC